MRHVPSRFLLAVSVLLCFSEVGIAKEITIWSAAVPVVGHEWTIECTILNVSDKAISGEIAMFAPGRFGIIPMGAGTFVDTRPGEASGISGSTSNPGPGGVYCRITFDGNKKDVRANFTVYSAGVPILTVPVE